MKGGRKGEEGGEKGGKEGENTTKLRNHFTFITGSFFSYMPPMVNK